MADENVAAVTAAIDALGLATSVSPLRAGLVACTGATGCRFAAAHTKESADEIAAWCETHVAMDTPVNIHLTGCHHSCAQHYIGDIGLIGARVPINDEGDTVDGFNILIGGGYGPDATIARELFTNVKAEDAPRTVAHILNVYLRAAPVEGRVVPRIFAARGRRRIPPGSKVGGCGMNQLSPAPALSLIPETAPFTAEQRAWLNGFFAGLVSLDCRRTCRCRPSRARR